jgi:hypothetical protein
MNTLRRYATLGAAIWLAACASASGGGAAGGGTASGSRGQDRTTLTAENLRAHAGRNLYDVIRQERPHWLNTRGAGTLNGPVEDIVVYYDGSRMGGSAYLRGINADLVESVRYMSGPEASSRYGLNHQNGAIVITTRK